MSNFENFLASSSALSPIATYPSNIQPDQDQEDTHRSLNISDLLNNDDIMPDYSLSFLGDELASDLSLDLPNCKEPGFVTSDYLRRSARSLFRTYNNQRKPDTVQAMRRYNIAKNNINQLYSLLLQNDKFCNNNNDMYAKLGLANLNETSLNTQLNSMENYECLVKSLFEKNQRFNNIIGRFQIGVYFSSYDKIGEPSVYGEIVQPYYKSETTTVPFKLPFLVKASKRLDNVDIRNEAVVGYTLNQLRNTVPNFVYTLGVMNCSPLIIDDIDRNSINDQPNNEVKSFCDADGKQTYIALEKIDNATSLKSYLLNQNLTFNDWFNIYLQVVIALYNAQRFNFTHYDLHTGNVLLQNFDNTQQYVTNTPFGLDNSSKYVKFNKLARIIDFGSSHIVINNRYTGSYKPELNIFSDRNFACYDVYKLFMFSAYYIKRNKVMTKQQKDNILTKMEPIFRFFNNKDQFIDSIVNGNSSHYTLYTQNNDYTRLNFDEFIECLSIHYVNDIYNNVSNSPYTGIPGYRTMVQPQLTWATYASNQVINNYNIVNYQEALYLQDFTNTNFGAIIQNKILNFVNNVWNTGNLEFQYQMLLDDLSDLRSNIANFSGEPNNPIDFINLFYTHYNRDKLLSFSVIQETEYVVAKLAEFLHDFQTYYQKLADFNKFNTLYPTNASRQKSTDIANLKINSYRFRDNVLPILKGQYTNELRSAIRDVDNILNNTNPDGLNIRKRIVLIDLENFKYLMTDTLRLIQLI